MIHYLLYLAATVMGLEYYKTATTDLASKPEFPEVRKVSVCVDYVQALAK